MIENTFVENHPLEWVERNITNPTDELVLLRKIIPWEKIVKQLSQFYNKLKGRTGKSLRIMAGLMILSRLRLLSDDNLVKQVKQNRYYQYFCNVPDKDLAVFMNPAAYVK